MKRDDGVRVGRDKAKSKRRRKTAADKADRHALYQRAVQDPQTDATTLAKLYRRFRKQAPLVLREDFCGTAVLTTEWVKSKKGRIGVGIDLDQPTLDWGQEHNVDAAGKRVAKNVRLFCDDVLKGRRGPKADIGCALNFSYCCFKQRAELLAYFKATRKTLQADGLFVLDVLGGTETMRADKNVVDHGDFTYRWEQEFFDPLTHAFGCHIHFSFPDGSKLERAFSYDWRLWTMPELYDILLEAGYSKVHRMWERTDDKGEGTGVFFEPKRVENQEIWWTYLVAER